MITDRPRALRRQACRRRDDRGVGAPEFIIVMPVVMLIFLMLVQWSVQLYNDRIVHAAAREAAVDAASWDGTEAAGQQTAKEYLADSGSDLSNTSVRINVGATEVTVTVEELAAGRRAAQGSHQPAEGQLVALGPEARDDPERCRREPRMAAFRLARVDVGQVDLHEREGHARERVPQRQARVRPGARVHQRAGHHAAAVVDRLDHASLLVELREEERHPEFGPHLLEMGFDLGQRGRAVDLGLPDAEQIEIRAVEDRDPHDVSPFSQPWNWSRSSSSPPSGPPAPSAGALGPDADGGSSAGTASGTDVAKN